jgi:sensor domain CHASE-containing protein
MKFHHALNPLQIQRVSNLELLLLLLVVVVVVVVVVVGVGLGRVVREVRQHPEDQEFESQRWQ